MNDATLGVYLRARRQRLGLTLHQVSAGSGVHFSDLAKAEKGQMHFGRSRLTRVVRTLGGPV